MLGATGPVDAALRRPWIDWIHTARDQGAIVRGYVKWDDQPASPAAAREALLRANWLARTEPQGPVYVNLDAGMQEAPLAAPLPPIDRDALRCPTPRPRPTTTRCGARRSCCAPAARPLILMGRVSRDARAWNERVALAERLGASVVTDLKVGAAFPTDHPQHVGAPARDAARRTRRARSPPPTSILSLDWVDLAGTLKAACGGEPKAKVVQASLDHVLHNGWSMDHQGWPPVDVHLACDAGRRGARAARRAARAQGRAARRRRTRTPRRRSPTARSTTDHVAARAAARRRQAQGVARAPAAVVERRELAVPRARSTSSAPTAAAASAPGPGLGVGAALALRDARHH